MSFTINQSALLPVLKRAESMVASVGAFHFRQVYMEQRGGSLKLLASDGSMQFTAKVTGSGSGFAVFGVNARRLRELVSRWQGEITLEFKPNNSTSDPDIGGSLVVRNGKSRVSLPTVVGTSRPSVIEPPESGARIFWSADLLRELLDKTVPYVTDEVDSSTACLHLLRHEVGGERKVVFFGVSNTQGLRVSLVNNDLYDMLPEDGLLIHRGYAKKLQGWKGADTVELCRGERGLFITDESTRERVYIPRQQETALPMSFYDNVYAAPEKHELIVDRAAFAAAMDMASMCATPDSFITTLTLAEDSVSVSIQTAQGNAMIPVPAEYTGSLPMIFVSAKHLPQVLNSFTSKTIRLVFSDPSSPALALSDAEQDTEVVFMPMALPTTQHSDQEEQSA